MRRIGDDDGRRPGIWRVLEPVSIFRMAAKLSLRNAVREARSAVWSFHSSDERHSNAPAKTLPEWVSTHWSGILCCTPCECATAIRRGARRVPAVRQKRGSGGILRQVRLRRSLLSFFCWSVLSAQRPGGQACRWHDLAQNRHQAFGSAS